MDVWQFQVKVSGMQLLRKRQKRPGVDLVQSTSVCLCFSSYTVWVLSPPSSICWWAPDNAACVWEPIAAPVAAACFVSFWEFWQPRLPATFTFHKKEKKNKLHRFHSVLVGLLLCGVWHFQKSHKFAWKSFLSLSTVTTRASFLYFTCSWRIFPYFCFGVLHSTCFGHFKRFLQTITLHNSPTTLTENFISLLTGFLFSAS